MYLILRGHNQINDVQTMTQVFFPNQEYKLATEPAEGITVLSELDEKASYCIVYEDGKLVARAQSPLLGEDTHSKKRAVKAAIYEALTNFTGMTNPWGLLTGIRPAKLFSEHIDAGETDEQIRAYFRDEFFIEDAKIDVAMTVARNEQALIRRIDKNAVSLYIGIPFCPSRCIYCSFASNPYAKYKNRIGEYLDALIRDMRFCAESIGDRKIQTVYFGGGTPTALNAQELRVLLEETQSLFDIKNVAEVTVEAGRPDTIDAEKLQILLDYGIKRISINPQTLHDQTLRLIGRNHTVDEFYNAYELARGLGFENINIDLIVGLPGETPEMVRQTFDGIKALAPSAITVHTLSVKRASPLMERIRESANSVSLSYPAEICEMLDIAAESARDIGLLPYYMYRQKNMLGNFENVGYAKPGFECLYNVITMEENQAIAAMGAGAVSKLIGADGLIWRVFNVKNVDEYIARIDEMIERKRAGFNFR